MVELNGVRIWAVEFQGLRVLPARKLVCGTLAHPLAMGRWPDGGRRLPGSMVVPGRSDVSVAWTGWFELSTGEVVAVYGAKVEPLG